MTTNWFEGPLAALCTRATGADPETDRMVSASVVVQDAPGVRPRVTRWLVNPGVPVPPEATAAQGLTEEQLRRNGRWPAPVMAEVAHELQTRAGAGLPLVVMDAPFDLTLLDRELGRHRSSSLAAWFGPVPLLVLDPHVLDRHLDRYRKGRRARADLCRHYGVTTQGAQDAAADALASLEVVRALGRRFASRLERLTPAELHGQQALWHAAQARGPQTWFGRGTPSGTRAGHWWPLRPALPTAA